MSKPIDTDTYCEPSMQVVSDYIERRRRVGENLGNLTHHEEVYLDKTDDKKPADMEIVKE